MFALRRQLRVPVAFRLLRPLSSATHRPIAATIKQDHDRIREVYEQLVGADIDSSARERLANEFIRDVAVHSVAEELVIYPAIRAKLPQGRTLMDHLLSEHQAVKRDLHQLDRMSMNDPQFPVIANRVMTELSQHMQEEEREFLPLLTQEITERESLELSEQFERLKQRVPTHPHPHAPNKPPLETLIAKLQAPLDKGFDKVRRDFPSEQELSEGERERKKKVDVGG